MRCLLLLLPLLTADTPALATDGVIERNVVARSGGTGVNTTSFLVVGNTITSSTFSGLIGSGVGYLSNVFTGNSPDVSPGSGIQLDSNLCSGVPCP